MTREGLKQDMLLAMSEHHSGNSAEAQRIVDAILAAIEAAGVRLVSFAALAEDEAAVERVARAMLADELNVRPTLTFAPTWEQESDIWLSNARAAIRAMGGE